MGLTMPGLAGLFAITVCIVKVTSCRAGRAAPSVMVRILPVESVTHVDPAMAFAVLAAAVAVLVKVLMGAEAEAADAVKIAVSADMVNVEALAISAYGKKVNV